MYDSCTWFFVIFSTDTNPYSNLSNTYMENYANTNTIMMNIHQFNNVHDIEMEIKYCNNLLDLYKNKICILENLNLLYYTQNS